MLPAPGDWGDRLGRFLETIPAIIWSADPETFVFTYVNRAAESILGYPVEEWLEPDFWRSHLHPEDLAVVEKCRSFVAARRDHELTYRMIAADGKVVWLRDRVHVLAEDGKVVELCGAMFDVSAEHETFDALARSEETYRLIVQTSPDAIGIHSEGRYIYVNPKFVQIFGAASEAELIGRDVLSLVHPDFADDVRARHVQLSHGESVPMMHQKFIRLDGSEVDVEVMAIPVTFNGVRAVQVVARDISDRLKTSERLELLSAGSSEALWEGNLSTDEFWSNAVCQQFIGRFTKLSAARQEWARRIHPDDRHRTEIWGARIMEKAISTWSNEYRIQKLDGSWAWVLARGRLIEDGSDRTRIIGSLVDITSLREAEQRYLQIFEEVQDVIYTLDLEGKITALNRSFETKTGYRINDWIGRSIAEILTPESVPIVFEELSRVLQGEETAPAEYRIHTASGAILDIEASGHPRIVDGVVVGSVGIIRDVTERNLLQQRLENEKRISSLGQLAASVAHEFNNVLMSVQPFVEILLRSCAPSQQADTAGRHIKEAVSRGKRITNEILIYANPKDPQLEPMDVSAWLESFVASVRETFPSTISVSYVERSTSWVLCDEYQLGQVIMNLATNASDAMPGGGSLTIELSEDVAVWKMRAGLVANTKYVRISVTDTGCGITPQGLASLWEPLYTTKRGGTGLGLPIAKRLIERQNGVIVVDTEPGKGTAFHLFLQAAEPFPEMPALKDEATPHATLERVLLAEDDEAVGEGIEAMLELEGIQCRRVLTGEEVFDAMREFNPQVIILDINLPGISGIEVCERIRRSDPRQPVILSTGHVTGIEISPHTRALLKPYSCDELIEACQLAMED